MCPSRAELPYEGEPINYLYAPVNDPIARLQKRVETGEAKLPFDHIPRFVFIRVPMKRRPLAPGGSFRAR